LAIPKPQLSPKACEDIRYSWTANISEQKGTNGDVLDGKFTFIVVGNQDYDMRVTDGQLNYLKTMFFERGGTKIINVEPGTAVYA
jgi:hypothetical protein